MNRRPNPQLVTLCVAGAMAAVGALLTSLWFLISPAPRSSLLVALAGFVGVILASPLVDALYRRFDPLEAKNVFLATMAIFVIPLPMRAFLTLEVIGNVSEHLPDFWPYLAPAVWLVTAGLLFFYVGYHSPLALEWGRRLPQFSAEPTPAFRRRLFFLQGFSILLILMLMLRAGGVGAYLAMGYAASEATFGVGYLAVGFSWFLVTILLAFSAVRHGRGFMVWYAIAIMIGFLALMVILGDRHTPLYLIMALILYRHHAVKPIKTHHLVAGVVLLFVALNVFGMLRVAKAASVGDLVGGLGVAWQALIDGGDIQALFYTLTIGEFVIPFESLAMLIKATPHLVGYRWGLTYLQAPMFLIPSAVFPDRPQPLPNWFYDTFYPGIHPPGQGRAFFLFSEAYLNFGVLGVLLVMLIVGLLLGALHAFLRNQRQGRAGAILYALIVAWIVRGVPGDSAGIIAGLTQQSLVAAFFVIMANPLRKYGGGLPSA